MPHSPPLRPGMPRFPDFGGRGIRPKAVAQQRPTNSATAALVSAAGRFERGIPTLASMNKAVRNNFKRDWVLNSVSVSRTWHCRWAPTVGRYNWRP